MSARTIQVPLLDLRASVDTFDDERRTLGVIFTTGADVLRYDWETGERYYERLSLDPKHVRMEFLNSGRAPLLDTHSSYTVANQLGIVEPRSAVLVEREGRALVRFSKRAHAVYEDAKEKLLPNISVGYVPYRVRLLSERVNDIPVRETIDWEPREISLCPLGADRGARVRSSRDIETHTCVVVTRGDDAPDADRLRRVRLARAC